MQAWKSIINFVYVLPERLSSLWQVQCVAPCGSEQVHHKHQTYESVKSVKGLSYRKQKIFL